MTIEQFRRAKEIENEIADIQAKWNLANDPATIITNSDGSPCDRDEALKRFHKELQEQADRLKKEFDEL